MNPELIPQHNTNSSLLTLAQKENRSSLTVLRAAVRIHKTLSLERRTLLLFLHAHKMILQSPRTKSIKDILDLINPLPLILTLKPPSTVLITPARIPQAPLNPRPIRLQALFPILRNKLHIPTNQTLGTFLVLRALRARIPSPRSAMPISTVPRATLLTLLALETIRQEVEDTGAAMAADCLGVAVLVGGTVVCGAASVLAEAGFA